MSDTHTHSVILDVCRCYSHDKYEVYYFLSQRGEERALSVQHKYVVLFKEFQLNVTRGVISFSPSPFIINLCVYRSTADTSADRNLPRIWQDARHRWLVHRATAASSGEKPPSSVELCLKIPHSMDSGVFYEGRAGKYVPKNGLRAEWGDLQTGQDLNVK